MPWHTWILKPWPETFFDKHVAVVNAARLDLHAHLPSVGLRDITLYQFPVSTGKGDGGHGDDRTLGQPLFQCVVLRLTFCQTKATAIVWPCSAPARAPR